MDNQNRFEDVPQNENKVGKFFKGLGKYFANVFLGFIDSFKYNNMKLASILIAIPGLLIGFFLNFHAKTVNQMSFEFIVVDTTTSKFVNCLFPGMPIDGTAICIFLLMLFGILNIFTALSMSGKKNLASVVIATVLTSLLVILTVYYVYSIFYYKKLTTDGVYIDYATGSDGYRYYVGATKKIINNNISIFNSNYAISMISIIICDVLSIAGVVLGFINYDRTYEKVDR